LNQDAIGIGESQRRRNVDGRINGLDAHAF
jgi:hypothetical protein